MPASTTPAPAPVPSPVPLPSLGALQAALGPELAAEYGPDLEAILHGLSGGAGPEAAADFGAAETPAFEEDADPENELPVNPYEGLTDEEIEALHRTLEDPRHEAFAYALASGATPADAYDAAGFSPKNRKARAEALSKEPEIVTRVANLLKTNPDIEDSYWLHARPFTTMPECPERMAVWLWQVMSGTRKLESGQLQAAKLFMRLHNWDQKDITCRMSAILPVDDAPAFALLSNVQAIRETQRHSAPLLLEAEAGESPHALATTSLTQLPTGRHGDSHPHAQLLGYQATTP